MLPKEILIRKVASVPLLISLAGLCRGPQLIKLHMKITIESPNKLIVTLRRYVSEWNRKSRTVV